MIFYKYEDYRIKIHLMLFVIIIFYLFMLFSYIYHSYNCILIYDPTIETIYNLGITIVFDIIFVTFLSFLALGFPLIVNIYSCRYITRIIIIMTFSYLVYCLYHIFGTVFPVIKFATRIILGAYFLILGIILSWYFLKNIRLLNRLIANVTYIDDIRMIFRTKRKLYLIYGTIIIGYFLYLSILQAIILYNNPKYKRLQSIEASSRMATIALLWLIIYVLQPRNFIRTFIMGIEVNFV